MSTQLAPTPILDDATEIAIFLHDLESLDECRCESESHAFHGERCSVKVTHRFFYCAGSFNGCATVAKRYQKAIRENHRCIECGHRAETHWSYIPI